MATWAIGDVHGCFRTLEALLGRLPFEESTDDLWMVGDLVNKGPDSLAVLRWAKRRSAELGERMVVVLGNHDVHLLAMADGLRDPSTGQGLDDVLNADDGDELVAWLRHRPLLHRTPVGDNEHLLIHAGLLPGWTSVAAERRARRAEEVLRGPQGLARLLATDEPEIEAECETFAALTRLRMLDTRGRFCDHAGRPEDAPAGCVSWFDHEDRRSAESVAVAGHWAALGRRLRRDLVALDSGCVYGGELTAVRLEDRAVVSELSHDA